MSVSFDRDIVVAVLLLGVVWGLALVGVGVRKVRTSSLLLGVTIMFYTFTVITYVPLMGSPASPLSMTERMWGAMTAVVAGASLLGLVANQRNDRRAADEDIRVRSTILLSMVAAISLAAIFYSLKPYTGLPPSADFLNEYGHLAGIFAYQLIFAVWVSVPASTLGWSFAKTASFGWPRLLVAAGGVCAALWGVWKIGGAVASLLRTEIVAASPVSVGLGLSALVLCIAGLAMTRWRETATGRRERAEYRQARVVEDEQFRAGGV